MEPSPRAPQFGEPGYNLRAFGRDVFGGGLRWLASVFAVLGAALVVCIFAGVFPPELDWPIHVTGTAAKALSIGTLVLWLAVAVVSWWFQAKARRGGR
jgi:hypothetical protein